MVIIPPKLCTEKVKSLCTSGKVVGLVGLCQEDAGTIPNPLHTIKSIPEFLLFFLVENHKVSTSMRGGFQVVLHKIFLEQVYFARLSCTADARPLTGFEKGPNLAEIRVEYVLLTT